MSFTRGMVLRCLVLVLILVSLEGVARLAARFYAGIHREYKTQADWFRYSPVVGWEPRPEYKGDIYGVARTYDEHSCLTIDSEQIRRHSLPKMLILGDSTSFGWGVSATETYAEFLDRAFPRLGVINLSVPGYSSYQGLKLLERYCPRLKPAYVVVSFHANDRRYMLHPEQVDSAAWFRKVYWAEVYNRIQQHLYLLGLLRLIISGQDTVSGIDVQPQTGVSYYVDELTARVPPDQYQKNLEQMVVLADKHTFKLLFLYLPANPIMLQPIRQARELIRQNRAKAARDLLVKAVNRKDWYSVLARKYLIQIDQQRGWIDTYRTTRKLEKIHASAHGGSEIFLDSEYGALMSDTADHHGVNYCDGGQVLNEANERFFIDQCHFDARGHKEIARLLAQQISVMEQTAQRKKKTHE